MLPRDSKGTAWVAPSGDQAGLQASQCSTSPAQSPPGSCGTGPSRQRSCRSRRPGSAALCRDGTAVFSAPTAAAECAASGPAAEAKQRVSALHGAPQRGAERAVLTSASCSDGSCRDWRWACTITPVQSSRAISRIVFHSCCRYFCRTAPVGAQGQGRTRDPCLHSRLCHRRCRPHQHQPAPAPVPAPASCCPQGR